MDKTTLGIARCFLRLGAQGFGGLGAVLSLILDDVVKRRRWLDEADITEALTYTKLLPGSTAVQVVAYIGWKLRGLSGAFVATVAFLLPSVLMMLCLAAGYRFVAPLSGVPAALQGLTAAVVGLLAVTTVTLGRKNIVDITGVVLAAGSLWASVHYGFNPALVVIVAGLLGVLREAVTRRP